MGIMCSIFASSYVKSKLNKLNKQEGQAGQQPIPPPTQPVSGPVGNKDPTQYQEREKIEGGQNHE